MLTDVPTRVAEAARSEVLQFLLGRGAAEVAHPGGRLFEHLLRTAVRLADWGVDEPLVTAGLCHAVYGTDGFATSLAELFERHVVRGMLGEDAEAMVYLYAAADRSVAWDYGGSGRAHRDRFTGKQRDLSECEAVAFWTLTASNELDLVGRMTGAENALPLLESRSDLLWPSARGAVKALGRTS